MSFRIPFEVGTEVSNDDIIKTFGVDNNNGIRPSSKNNLIVLVLDHKGALYDDGWKDGLLHYTGTGRNGDQTIERGRNKTLANAAKDNKKIFLFERYDTKGYTYSGEVELAGEPYQTEQQDDNGNIRMVWMFPLKKVKIEEDEKTGLLDVGTVVYTHNYGNGTITQIKDGLIYVQFNKGERLYSLEIESENGVLKIVK